MNKFIFIKKYLPRWVILFIDLIISLGSILSAYFLRFNFRFPKDVLLGFAVSIPLYLTVRLISFLISKTYAGIIRYTSTKDALRVFFTNLLGTIVLMLFNLVSYVIIGSFIIPYSVLIIDLAIIISTMIAFRIIIKAIYYETLTAQKFYKNVLIYGGDEYGLAVKRALERDPKENFKIIAFIDNFSKGKIIDGIEIFSLNELERLIEINNISIIILAKKQKYPKIESLIINTAIENNIKVLRVPSADQWINGEISFKQIKKLKIEDLLEREPIKLDTKNIRNKIQGKNVIVTGAAGSIGSEIVRQIIKFQPKLLIMIDQAESQLYDLELEIIEKLKFTNFKPIIADITDEIRMNKIFESFSPDIIFHAAAYKHVPMMEKHPYEAIKTNVGGTKILADLSVKHKVGSFIMISTDKAVNPTNIMGASKRIAEIYIQALNSLNVTSFITTRFGNVLGSNGSVIPRFYKQIEEGGPVTVTHPEITRYFMTIPEACQLVLEAGTFGRGGEIFIFDMGKSVKIIDLAKKMIKLSGLKLGIDIQIKITGLRPGEKLYEELLHDKENTIPTYNKKIMIAKVKQYELEFVKKAIDELLQINREHDDFKIVKKMKSIVPEFKSKNSKYESLDQ